jgi:hypothetical protein
MLIVLGLLLGGVLQGSQLTNRTTDFLVAMSMPTKFMGFAILGYLAMFVGQVAFLLNFVGLACGACCGSKEGARR